ncbi:hypothetical protein PMZ80_002677 [Knufia obscura]|nr:hypothetical protein PMZ80_002677 [Knufia obscura]
MLGTTEANEIGDKITASQKSLDAAHTASVQASFDSISRAQQRSSDYNEIVSNVDDARSKAETLAKAANQNWQLSDDPSKNVFTFNPRSAPVGTATFTSIIGATGYNAASFETSVRRTAPLPPAPAVSTLSPGTAPSSIPPGVPE